MATNSSIGGIAVILIFATTIVGLYVVNGLGTAESYEDDSNHVFLDTAFSENEFVKTFNEIDGNLQTFLADLRKDLGSSLFILDY